jgi:hypothetical protein
MSNKKDIIPLEEVLIRFENNKKEFRDKLEKQEDYENSIETHESITNDIKGVKQSTEIKKNSFINEIKSGLGNEVKRNPNGIKVIKKSGWQRFKESIKKLFTRF